MVKNKLRFFRIFFEISFFVFITSSFFCFPLRGIPSKTQIVPILFSVFSKEFFLSIFFVIFFIFVTFFFGRIYCSFFCPLGGFQDIFIRVGRYIKKNKFKYQKPLLFFRFTILFFLLISLFSGSSYLISWLDPYSIFGKMINYLIKPIFVVINNLGEFFLRKRGFYFFRILDFPDFNLFIISILGLILGGVIYFSLKEGRFYCNSICPLGTFLSLVSFRSLCRIEIDKLRCTSCGICEFNCKGSCINSKEKIIDDFSCIRCFNCLSICPFSAIRFRFVSFIKKRKEKNIERRKFILYLTYICFLGINLFLREKGKKLSNSSPPTPPGSISLKRFLSKCTSCYLCVNRCPTGVLRPSLFQYGIFGAFVPFMDFRSGYCSYECNECLNICPTNAILPFRLEEKKKIQIGRVNFTQDFCVVYKNKTNCGACAEICPTEAIRMVPYKGLLSIPFTEPSICVGCGGCAFVCPATPKAIVIETNLVHREVKSFERSKNKKENRKEEFPF